jgi:hypothetical protein
VAPPYEIWDVVDVVGFHDNGPYKASDMPRALNTSCLVFGRDHFNTIQGVKFIHYGVHRDVIRCPVTSNEKFLDFGLWQPYSGLQAFTNCKVLGFLESRRMALILEGELPDVRRCSRAASL